MGSGDLNMKKSWHPQRSGNVAATQKAEAEAIAERKKLQQRLQEIEEERKKEEIQKALEAAGGKRKIDRVEWMYAGPTDGQADGAESEAYLLGKRRIDKLLQDNEVKKLSKQPSQDQIAAAAVPAIANARDIATKIREDPLLAIKRQEQQAYEAMMTDPIKRRQLLVSMGIDDAAPKSSSRGGKEERRHKHRHHHHHRSSHRHRDDDQDDGDRSSRRRRSDSRDRSRSPPRRHSSEEEDGRRRRRRDSPERRRHRSDSGDERRRDSRDRRDSGRAKERREREQSRSASPAPRKRRDYSAERDVAPPPRARREREGWNNDSSNRDSGSYRPCGGDRNEDVRPRQANGSGRTPVAAASVTASSDKEQAEQERARKLAAMRDAASNLDLDRERRLAAIEASERAAREVDDRARQRNKKSGGDGTFTNALHSRAADLKVYERMGRA
ncbi:Pre-mRNA splicing factor-domain-containing protein [Bombardia bombarda]|uniref:Pre-mRNA splicing factor-domain-containing protein n=1 Tax=Bombardia bombarda TaxID=252184 RepID=A0AA39X7L8_9PEZI|nr:Pre-mRNA splicing factor-domain-containing protein [Bombardia bombarda]